MELVVFFILVVICIYSFRLAKSPAKLLMNELDSDKKLKDDFGDSILGWEEYKANNP